MGKYWRIARIEKLLLSLQNILKTEKLLKKLILASNMTI
jgi:hypothetical protein